MADPFVGEIRMFSFNFAPRNWALCNGASIPITQNPTLYSLLGIQFGGDGRTNFMLPDLRGRVPSHKSGHIPQGTQYGFESIVLHSAEMPTHTHSFYASEEDATDSNIKSDNSTLFAVANGPFYSQPANMVELSSATSSSVGGNAAHENRQPSLAVNFSIALIGLYPSRN